MPYSTFLSEFFGPKRSKKPDFFLYVPRSGRLLKNIHPLTARGGGNLEIIIKLPAIEDRNGPIQFQGESTKFKRALSRLTLTYFDCQSKHSPFSERRRRMTTQLHI